MLNHQWLTEDGEEHQNVNLDNVAHNLFEFCNASNFQKTIISLLAGLRLQQEELEEIKKMFNLLDKNKDGTLSKAELRQGLDNLTLFEMLQDLNEDEDSFQAVIEKIDLDNDGRIDYIEFMQSAIKHKALLNQKNLQIVFNMLDTNNDGTIDKNELK